MKKDSGFERMRVENWSEREEKWGKKIRERREREREWEAREKTVCRSKAME